MSSLPFSLGQKTRGIAGSIGERYRAMQDQIRSAAAQAGSQTGPEWLTGYLSNYTDFPEQPDATPDIGSLVHEGLGSIAGGLRGAAQGTRNYVDSLFRETPNPALAGPVGSDGVPERLRESLLPKQQPMAIEEHLNAKAAEVMGSNGKPPVGADGVPETLRKQDWMPEAPLAPPPGRVQVSFGGKTYDYSGGRDGGAPLAGGQLGSLFGRPWTNEATDQTHEFAGEGNGSYSQMTENPAMKTLGQLKDEQALADARPSAQGGSVGEQRGIAQEIEKKRAEYEARAGAEVSAERGKSGIRLGEQESRRNDYENAIAEEVSNYQAARARIDASGADEERKAKAHADAQAMHDAQRQTIREAFGFGSNLGAAIRQD